MWSPQAGGLGQLDFVLLWASVSGLSCDLGQAVSFGRGDDRDDLAGVEVRVGATRYDVAAGADGNEGDPLAVAEFQSHRGLPPRSRGNDVA